METLFKNNFTISLNKVFYNQQLGSALTYFTKQLLYLNML